MPHGFIEIAADERLVLVGDAAKLPLVVEMVRPHVPRVRLLVGPHTYLIARDRASAEACRMAVAAADIYDRVELAHETPLRLPAGRELEHRARVRVAKARASQLYSGMQRAYRRATQREERHGRVLAHGEGIPGAIATWQNERFQTLMGWGDRESYASDPAYHGDVVCRVPERDAELPQWLRMPEDEGVLLAHPFGADPEVDVRASRAHLLGIRSAGDDA